MALLRSMFTKLPGLKGKVTAKPLAKPRSLKDSQGREIKIVVHAPEATPSKEKLYVSGACSQLGQWNPVGVPLKQTNRGVWEAKVCVPADQPIDFKVTRGSWEKVERHADGTDTGNHHVEPVQMADEIHHTVERWSDAA